MLSCRLPDTGPADAWFAGLRAFISSFFRCEECRDHFQQQLVALPADATRSRDAAMLWFWAAHNRVNARLALVRPLPLSADPAMLWFWAAHNRVNARLALVRSLTQVLPPCFGYGTRTTV